MLTELPGPQLNEIDVTTVGVAKHFFVKLISQTRQLIIFFVKDPHFRMYLCYYLVC
jgi:hypothetical protein